LERRYFGPPPVHPFQNLDTFPDFTPHADLMLSCFTQKNAPPAALTIKLLSPPFVFRPDIQTASKKNRAAASFG
jgi:hypothetical protein